MRHIVSRILEAAFALLALTLACATHAQESQSRLLLDRKPGEGPTLLVLGSAHFANPGRDMVNVRVEDMLTEKRQEQIAKVVDELAAFRPTFIAIEWPQAQQARLESAYGEYRARRQPLNASEHQQLGFRLADKLNLARVHAIDWNGMPPGDTKVYDFPAWANANGQKAGMQALTERIAAQSVRLGADETVGSWLIRLNLPQALLDNHRTYFDIAMFGDAEAQPGAAWVGTWYARNLRIFANLTRLTSNPQDRILVIYGVGHAYLLRQFAVESNAFRVIDVNQVLKGR
jgi:hypothetical protein